jgi:hypothetical protein
MAWLIMLLRPDYSSPYVVLSLCNLFHSNNILKSKAHIPQPPCQGGWGMCAFINKKAYELLFVVLLRLCFLVIRNIVARIYRAKAASILFLHVAAYEFAPVPAHEFEEGYRKRLFRPPSEHGFGG